MVNVVQTHPLSRSRSQLTISTMTLYKVFWQPSSAPRLGFRGIFMFADHGDGLEEGDVICGLL